MATLTYKPAPHRTINLFGEVTQSFEELDPAEPGEKASLEIKFLSQEELWKFNQRYPHTRGSQVVTPRYWGVKPESTLYSLDGKPFTTNQEVFKKFFNEVKEFINA